MLAQLDRNPSKKDLVIAQDSTEDESADTGRKVRVGMYEKAAKLQAFVEAKTSRGEMSMSISPLKTLHSSTFFHGLRLVGIVVLVSNDANLQPVVSTARRNSKKYLVFV